MKPRMLSFALLFVAAFGGPTAISNAAEQDKQFVPMLAYRTGSYAAGGSGFSGGFEDHLALINIRDKGVNGVKFAWEECETGYDANRGVECYEKLKNKGPTGATVIQPLSTGITYRLIERASADRIPIISMGYGPADASDGRVFPWVFPLITNYWSQNTTKIKFIAMQEGGMDKLKGKKISDLYHQSSYGRETISILNKQAEIYGFEVKHYPVSPPGLEPLFDELAVVWLDITRRYNPDWVILRGWGEMNPNALKEAVRVGFPRDRIVGVWWSGAEEDVIPGGEAAIGYIAAGFHPSGTDFPVIQDIIKHVHDGGRGNIERERVGTIYHNRGIIAGIITAEAIRTAQEKFGERPISGEEMRWGIENLNITPDRIKELGAEGLMQPIKVTCRDHEAGGAVKFQQWDGEKWKVITDWIQGDRSMVHSMVEESASAYAKVREITPRQGKSLGSDCNG